MDALALALVAGLVYNCWRRVQKIINNDKQKRISERDN